MQQCAVADGAAAAGDVLPAVARRAADEGAYVDLRCGSEPAHITDIAASGDKAGRVKERHQEIVDCLCAPLTHFFGEGGRFLREQGGDPRALAHRSGLLDLPCQRKLLRCEDRHSQSFKIPVEDLLEHVVGHQLGGTVDKAALEGSIGHQGGASRDVVDPLLQSDRILHLVCPDHVKHSGMVLHHVR